MEEATPRRSFSVIIPLEFHRGQAVGCVHAWASGQDFPRSDYEIIVAVPPGFAETDLAGIGAMLAPQDRVLRCVSAHDIALCAEAAKVAAGVNLFITESHCIPEPDVLGVASRVLAQRAEWAGFSCRSVPITHNPLSRIEAELYEKDIRYAMDVHPWRKVLDQCFVVRRWAYFRAGGLESELGHFAEWLLSARLYRAGLKIGYAPEVRVRHYYVGRWREWHEFTEDFTEGQMRFLQRGATDDCWAMFDEVPEWTQRHDLLRESARQVLKMLLRDLMTRGRRFRAWPFWRELARWSARFVLGPQRKRLPARWHQASLRFALRWHLMRKNMAAAARAYQACWESVVLGKRLDFLRRNGGANVALTQPPVGAASPGPGIWLPAHLSEHAAAGLHLLETDANGPFRWSEPAAFVCLDTGPGSFRVSLHLHPAVDGRRLAHARFFQDGKALAPECVKVRCREVELRVKVRKSGMIRLGWICGPTRAPGDPRRLGLALREIRWVPRGKPAEKATGSVTEAAAEKPRPFLFLHIRKTAGVALRSLLERRFAADSQAVPAHAPRYRDADFGRLAFVAGHLSFRDLGRFKERPFVFTVLRQPVERALSAHHFFKQHDEAKFRDLRGELSADEFAERVAYHEAARRLSLLDFLRSEPALARAHLSNVQTKCLLHRPPGDLLSESDLTQATGNLASCDVIGLTERLPETLMLLENAMGWQGIGPLAHENRTSGRPDRNEEDPEALEILAEWNRWDERLYAEAVRLFDERMERLLHGGAAARPERVGSLPSARDFGFDQPVHGWGWHPRERDADGACFCWTGAHDFASIDLKIDEAGASILRCHVRHSARPAAEESLRISVNGIRVPCRWRGTDSGRVVEAGVPRSVLALRPGRVRIAFEGGGHVRPSDVVPGSRDRRPLGIAFDRLSLEPWPG